MGIDWSLAGSVILSGLVLVFTILIILILLVEITGKVVSSAVKKAEPPKSAPVIVVPKPVVAAPAPAPVVQAGIEEETVAVISAAVYTCLNESAKDSGVSYAIQSIKRATGGRPVWGFAGMQQNTRPF